MLHAVFNRLSFGLSIGGKIVRTADGALFNRLSLIDYLIALLLGLLLYGFGLSFRIIRKGIGAFSASLLIALALSLS